ncbi:MAG TPA: hypothetical protein VMB19_14630 [Silvibacterium sp.]|nr:hypothetical protein [Silvibacterium sp.]
MILQETHKLAELLRENMTLRAEMDAMVNILDVAQVTGYVPNEWRSILKEQRKMTTYKKISEQAEPLIKHIEQAGDVNWDELLSNIPAAQLVD